jgi:hypothetical protein
MDEPGGLPLTRIRFLRSDPDWLSTCRSFSQTVGIAGDGYASSSLHFA